MIKTIDIRDIPADGRGHGNYGKRIRDIEHFISSNADACEVVLYPNENPKNVQTSYILAIGRRQYYKDIVRVVLRKGRLFLVRKEDKRCTK